MFLYLITSPLAALKKDTKTKIKITGDLYGYFLGGTKIKEADAFRLLLIESKNRLHELFSYYLCLILLFVAISLCLD